MNFTNSQIFKKQFTVPFPHSFDKFFCWWSSSSANGIAAPSLLSIPKTPIPHRSKNPKSSICASSERFPMRCDSWTPQIRTTSPSNQSSMLHSYKRVLKFFLSTMASKFMPMLLSPASRPTVSSEIACLLYIINWVVIFWRLGEFLMVYLLRMWYLGPL